MKRDQDSLPLSVVGSVLLRMVGVVGILGEAMEVLSGTLVGNWKREEGKRTSTQNEDASTKEDSRLTSDPPDLSSVLIRAPAP